MSDSYAAVASSPARATMEEWGCHAPPPPPDAPVVACRVQVPPMTMMYPVVDAAAPTPLMRNMENDPRVMLASPPAATIKTKKMDHADDDTPEMSKEEVTLEDTDVPAKNENDAKRPKAQEMVPREKDFDVAPTNLYLYLQKRKWDKCAGRLETAPGEVCTWIYRKDADGGDNLRWRLIPLHAAIIFQAPTDLVASILLRYPEAAKFRDDQGSLPIHLAHKRGASASTVRMLLDAYPESVDMKDRKKRTPRLMAVHGSGPKQEDYKYGVESYLLARKQAREEAREQFHARLGEMTTTHKKELGAVEVANQEKIHELNQNILTLEGELQETQDASQVLMNHISELEGRLACVSGNEASYSMALANGLTSRLDSKRANLDDVNADKADLMVQISGLRGMVEQLTLDKQTLTKSLDSAIQVSMQDKKKMEEQIEDQNEVIGSLKKEVEKARMHNTVLETQLKQRGANELSLASEIASLGAQLAQKADDSNKSSEVFSTRVIDLEDERDGLRRKVKDLGEKLYKVAGFLEEMTKEQQGIVEQAAAHEHDMEAVAREHGRILAQVKAQQLLDEEVQKSRSMISNLTNTQDHEYSRNHDARVKIVQAVEAHSERLQHTAAQRGGIVNTVKSLRAQLSETVADVLEGLPKKEEGSAEGDRSIAS